MEVRGILMNMNGGICTDVVDVIRVWSGERGLVKAERCVGWVRRVVVLEGTIECGVTSILGCLRGDLSSAVPLVTIWGEVGTQTHHLVTD